MKFERLVWQTVDVKFLKAECGVRYWEDATVNGIDDEDGTLIPCREDDAWCPVIDLETGVIQNWRTGVIACLHYKVCDDGEYALLAENGDRIASKSGYVPSCMSPKEPGHGDYVIMEIDGDGKIKDWQADLGYFVGEKN